MKKIIILILMFTTVGYLNAQEEKESNKRDIQTFFPAKPKKVRGYAAHISQITSLDKEMAYMSGFNAAGIFNDQIIIGFYNINLDNNIFINNNDYVGYNMEFDHRGLWLGYIFMPKRKIHFNTNLQVGKGELAIYDDPSDDWYEDDFIFVLTPSIEAEFNLAKFLRVGIGVNYRFAMDVNELNGYSDNDFSDFGTYFSLKFGWFN